MINAISNLLEGHTFYFDHVHLCPDEQIGYHSQSSWELSYIIVGSGKCRLGKNTYPFTSGEIVLLPPELPHGWIFNNKDVDADGKIENLTFVFNSTLLDRLASSFTELNESIQAMKNVNGALRFTERMAFPFRHILDEVAGKSEPMQLASLIYLLISIAENMDKVNILGYIDKTTVAEKRLKEVKTYVNCNYKRDISIDMISKFAGMNRSAFCSFFRKAEGMTFINYLNSYRVDVACNLLNRKKDSIAEICYQSGFRDIPYFNRVFKRIKGVTPGEFRNNIRL
jgi:AraC-like DNA-binding protein